MRQGKGGMESAATGAIEATDATADIYFLIHFHPDRAAGAAEVTLDAFFGIKSQMEQADPIE